jgi:hypothetical protein
MKGDDVTIEPPVMLEHVPLADLKPHSRNYRNHPDDQLEHIMAMVRQFGIYRNIVIARDNTILAGHGVTQALRKMGGFDTVPTIRLDIDPYSSLGLKLVVGDNEISHLGEIDDRSLTQILRDIRADDAEGLLGTGFDDAMLKNLVYITRPESEIEDFDAAAHWLGLPSMGDVPSAWKVVCHFDKEEDRAEFARRLGLTLTDSTTISTWWPPKEKDDMASVKFVVDEPPWTGEQLPPKDDGPKT